MRYVDTRQSSLPARNSGPNVNVLRGAEEAHCTSRFAGAASQASRRGPTLLDILEEKLQQLNEPLPGMDEDDAPVQNKDCAKPQGEDGGPGAEAGDDDDHHADVPSSPPSHAHLPELSVVPDTPLDGEPGDTENSRGQSASSLLWELTQPHPRLVLSHGRLTHRSKPSKPPWLPFDAGEQGARAVMEGVVLLFDRSNTASAPLEAACVDIRHLNLEGLNGDMPPMSLLLGEIVL